MVYKSEDIISCLLGFTRSDIRPVICALDVIIDLLFYQHLNKGDIPVTKSVYPHVAELLDKSQAAVSRSIQRNANRCWDSIKKQHYFMRFIGRELYDTPSAADVLFYLAFFAYHGKPFFASFDDLDQLDPLS